MEKVVSVSHFYLNAESWRKKSLKAFTELIGHLSCISTACSILQFVVENVENLISCVCLHLVAASTAYSLFLSSYVFA